MENNKKIQREVSVMDEKKSWSWSDEELPLPFVRCRGGIYITSSVSTFLASATAEATRGENSPRSGIIWNLKKRIRRIRRAD